MSLPTTLPSEAIHLHLTVLIVHLFYFTHGVEQLSYYETQIISPRHWLIMLKHWQSYYPPSHHPMHYNFYDIYKGDTGLIVLTHWVQQIVGVEKWVFKWLFLLASSVYYFTSRCYGQRCMAFSYSVKHNLLWLEFPVTKNKICQNLSTWGSLWNLHTSFSV